MSEIVWTQTSGTAVCNNADSLQASFDAPEFSENSADNLLAFTVTVTDDDGDSAQQQLTANVLAENILPVV